MTRDQAIQAARRIHAALERNADDIHFDRMTWETFEARNRALWDEAQADPRLKEMVLGLLRKDPNWQTPEERPMSKQKIDETMTEARIARGKRSKKEESPAETAPAQGNETEVGSKTEDSKKGKKAKTAPKAKAEPKPTREELVVFAFRLTEAERALIHRAAGPAKASRYVRALTIAASKGDDTAVKEILEAVRQNQT